MKLNTVFTTVVVLALACFASCKKNNTTTTHTTPTTKIANAELVVYMKCLNDSNREVALKDVTIKLYASETDRTADSHMIQQKTTSSSGSAYFSQLEKNEYFLHITHPSKGGMERTVSTPDKSVTYNTFVYQ